MIRILIVEDSNEKREILERALADVEGLEPGAIAHAPDLFSARRALLDRFFDIVILDIALPSTKDQTVETDAGLRLLDEMFERPDQFKTPAHIIGITAYPDIFAAAAGRFSSRLLTLVHFDPASGEWELALKARVRHVIRAAAARSEERIDYKSFLAVVCALDTPELTSVLGVGWPWTQVTLPTDHTIYWHSRLTNKDVTHDLYVASADRAGMPSAAILATKMIERFRPRYLAMVGIAAGIRGRAELGDLILADPCWDWGSGKWLPQEGGPKFWAAPHQFSITPAMRTKFRAMSHEAEVLARIRAEWLGNRPSSALSLHIGPVASGASVLADKEVTERLREQHRGLMGVEMEAYSIYAAADAASEPRPSAFVLKAVVDFADEEKNDAYQAYGAFVSAHALRHFVEHHLIET